MLRRFSVAIFLLIPLCCTADAQTATAAGSDLRWKLATGQKLQIEIQQQMNQEIEIAGNPTKTSTNTSTWIDWEVKEPDKDGNAQVESKVSRIVMNMDAPMVGKVTIDTQSEQEAAGMAKMIEDALKPVVGVPMTQTMNTRGEILDIQIPEDAQAGLEESSMPPMGSPADMVKQMARNAAIVFPEGALGVGQTFNSTSEAKTPMGTIKTTHEYTYRGETEFEHRKLHKFDVDMKLQFEGGENAMNAKFDVLEQNSTGTLYFDAEAGHLDSSEITQNMTVNISVAGQVLAQKMKQNMKMKVTELN